MGRNITYDAEKLPQLKERLFAVRDKINSFGYGSRAVAARWLMDNGHQVGDSTNQKDINRVAKKVAHILQGYVRGIHPTMYDGGVWSAEEAEHFVVLLEGLLESNPQIFKKPELILDQPRCVRPPRAKKMVVTKDVIHEVEEEF